MTTRYYARGKRVASESTGVYGDEWVCTMDGGHDAVWMVTQLRKAEAWSRMVGLLEGVREWAENHDGIFAYGRDGDELLHDDEGWRGLIDGIDKFLLEPGP